MAYISAFTSPSPPPRTPRPDNHRSHITGRGHTGAHSPPSGPTTPCWSPKCKVKIKPDLCCNNGDKYPSNKFGCDDCGILGKRSFRAKQARQTHVGSVRLPVHSAPLKLKPQTMAPTMTSPTCHSPTSFPSWAPSLSLSHPPRLQYASRASPHPPSRAHISALSPSPHSVHSASVRP